MARPGAVSRTGGGESTYRLPRTVIPSRYELAIEPDLTAGTFRGAEDIRITVREPVREIVLNAVDLRIEDGRLTNGNGTKLDVSEISLDRANERARVLLAEPAPPGEWTLHLEYAGVLNERL
ncbi:MAG TPA: hypothetical protein VGK11_04200, partial [Actinomycetota bacterium]